MRGKVKQIPEKRAAGTGKDQCRALRKALTQHSLEREETREAEAE